MKKKIKKLFLFNLCLTILIFATNANAQNIILMIGDGMGKNHISCTNKITPLFLSTLKPQGEILTHSANNSITDSAASATAYSCGIKTNNSYIGISPDKKPCKTLLELANENGYKTILRTTDVDTGATPAAFYAHTDSRHNTSKIRTQLDLTKKKSNIKSVQNIDTETQHLLSTLSNETQPFFLILEESEIDKQSHKNNLNEMQKALIRFDKAIKIAFDFTKNNKNTTLIILADHETGGLNNNCVYTQNNHTADNIPYYIKGKNQHLFYKRIIDNTDIHNIIKNIIQRKN